MKQHCERGYEMVRKIPFLREAAEIVYAHQERFDGTGYPRGLRGEDIPLGARIFAIADSLDAMTSDRPYRKGTTFAAATEEIVALCWHSSLTPGSSRFSCRCRTKLDRPPRAKLERLSPPPARSSLGHPAVAHRK